MKTHTFIIPLIVIGFSLESANRLRAHCDGMDGPVVKAAQKAIESGDVNTVLIWVQKQDEAEVRKAFEKTLAVRKLSSDAKELADRYFFEILVRLHRAGEGASFTGLKPAGRDLGPAIPAVDHAIDDGKPERVQELLAIALHAGVAKRFKEMAAKKNFDPKDVEAGREYVKAYVAFVHYVEGLHQAVTKPAHGHHVETKQNENHKDHDDRKHK